MMRSERAKFLFGETVRTFRKWRYYGLLLMLSVAFGSVMMLVMLDLFSREMSMVDARFVQPKRIIRYAWRDSSFDAAFDGLDDDGIAAKSQFYTRDEWVMSPAESRVLRVAHVDDAYLALAGQELAADEVALDEAYLSVFAVREGDMLTIGGQAYRVSVRRGLLDMEQQALIRCKDSEIPQGVPSMQCALRVSDGKIREDVRRDVENQLNGRVIFGNVPEIPPGMIRCVYPDEANRAALDKQRANLRLYTIFALLIFLYVTLQTTNMARCFASRTAREWAMLRLFCGMCISRAIFFCGTLMCAFAGVLLAWGLLPLFFRAIGSGFYVPQGSAAALLEMLPLLALLSLVMTRAALRQTPLVQQLSGA